MRSDSQVILGFVDVDVYFDSGKTRPLLYVSSINWCYHSEVFCYAHNYFFFEHIPRNVMKFDQNSQVSNL